jgi:hypothetical protein
MGSPHIHLIDPTPGGGRAQRGQAVPLVAALLLVVALMGAGLVRVAAASSARAATQAAADAAALAGANDGREAAERLARRNGATLVHYEEIELDVVVTVRRGRFTARARARWTATAADWRSGGGSAPRRVP